ncbi:lipoprotein [Spiroplasma apis]|uniref:Lipoprotein n=1 Tax=Spiroplasma apis B31 TaxID=1276258 RepID=V5RIY9_SPIAP|nr:lipoprotein [Spiroplasma apis]AHB36667.1 hypothetical protein SAPIS_v1c08220 [Spiroplasma apis B31]
MKKLLNLLGSVGLLVTPTITIVSCNSKNKTESAPKEETDNTKFFSEAIKDFKNEVIDIVTTNVLEANKSLIEIENKSQQNSFLNKANIERYSGKEKDLVKKEDKESLYKDVFTKMYVSKIKEEINNLKNLNKYTLILGNLNEVFEDLEIEWPSLKIDYNEDFGDSTNLKQVGNEDKPFASNVYLQFEIKTSYIDQANKRADFSVKKDFTYSLTNSKVIELLGKTVLNDMEYGYLLNGKEKSKAWLDSSSLNMKDKDKHLVDNNSEVENYFNNSSFNKDLTDTVKKVLEDNNHDSPWVKNAKLAFSENRGFSKIEWKYKLNSNMMERPKLYFVSDSIYGDAEKLFNYVFNRKEDIVKENKILGGVSQDVDVQIYNHLGIVWSDMVKKYSNEIDKFKDNVAKKIPGETNTEKIKTFDFSSTSNIGYVYLKDLELKIGDKYTQKLPEFRLLTAYSIDKENKNWTGDTIKGYEHSKTFESAYHNTIKGVNSFRQTFGIVDKSSAGGFTSITGQTPGIAKNLWTTFNSSEAWLKYGVNDSLSLNNGIQKEHRDYLLKTGNQEIFGWALFGEKSNTKVKVTTKGYINSGTVLGAQGNPFEDVNLRLDFININFRLPGYWNARAEGKTIIGRAS